jgi:hypothetical protein
MWHERYKAATHCLLTSDDRVAIHQALQEIHAICSEITTVRGDVLEPHHDEETFLDGGVAISPHLAARCLFDPLRTVQFLRGIHAGIHKAMRRFPGEPVHLLYAGCGPYATLVLPLTTQFSPEQIQLTLIDIHQDSIEGVKRLVKVLDVADYVVACRQADAITYRHPDSVPLHVVVCETMQAGLAQEPQVAIMLNLLPQLEGHGIFIPENIVVEACLNDPRQEDIGLLMHRDEFGFPVGRETARQSERLELGRILALNMETAREMNHDNGRAKGRDVIPLTTIEGPERADGADEFLFMTTVSVFGSFELAPYACELSFPLRVHELSPVEGGTRIQFSYAFEPKPGLRHQLLPIQAM